MSHAKMRLWNDFYCNLQDIIQTYSNSSFLQDMRDQNPRRTVKKKNNRSQKACHRSCNPRTNKGMPQPSNLRMGSPIRTFQLTCRKQEQNSTNPAEAKLFFLHVKNQENEEEEETETIHTAKSLKCIFTHCNLLDSR